MLQVRDILDKETPKDILEWLHHIQSEANFEENLLMVYHKELDRISKLSPKARNLAQKTLTWLYFAQRPLNCPELLDILRHERVSLISDLADEEAVDALVRI